MIKLTDLFVLVLFILSISRSAMYLVTGSDSGVRFLRYANLSPLPTAFVHRTFFAKKEITLNYASGSESLEYMESDEFFKARPNYRAFMFMSELDARDRDQVIEFYYCRNMARLGLKPRTEKLRSIDFTFHFPDGLKSVSYQCRH